MKRRRAASVTGRCRCGVAVRVGWLLCFECEQRELIAFGERHPTIPRLKRLQLIRAGKHCLGRVIRIKPCRRCGQKCAPGAIFCPGYLAGLKCRPPLTAANAEQLDALDDVIFSQLGRVPVVTTELHARVVDDYGSVSRDTLMARLKKLHKLGHIGRELVQYDAEIEENKRSYIAEQQRVAYTRRTLPLAMRER